MKEVREVREGGRIEELFMSSGPIPFDKIKLEDYEPAMRRGMELENEEMARIADNPEAPTFENTIEAMEQSGEEPGTVLKGKPGDLAKSQGMNMSLHDLRLVDLFDAAILLEYEAEGLCICVQVENTEPQYLTQDLTPSVRAAVPLVLDTLAAELAHRGVPFIDKETGEPYLGPKE